MKKVIILIFILSPLITYGQNSRRDSLVRVVDEYINTVKKAAFQFLNKDLSAPERIKAIEPFAIIYDSDQKEQFKNVVLDDNEPPEIRAMALNKIYEMVIDDQRLGNLVIEWLGNPKAPKVLRMEAIKFEGNMSFSSMNILDVYQKMLDDPELQIRMFAFTKLIIHGDPRAQQKLIDGLINPDIALLPAPTAIGILSMALKKEYYPAVYQVLQQTKDEETRLEAIRALGFYKEAREKIISISQDVNEKEPFREAALGALYGGDRENIVKYVTPILNDKSASPRLQAVAIQMTIDIRQAMSYRKSSKKADAYDILIKKIAEDKNLAMEVQNTASKYLMAVRPIY